jgi:DNA-binding transcriptional MerR regulator
MSENQVKARQKIYALNEMAKIARVTTEFIRECERENLIQVTIVQDKKGYGYETVRRLIRIRHLQRDLGLDLTAIDCILRMRRRIEDLQKQMRDMEERMLVREQEMMAEVQRLREQLAQDCKWKIM